MLSLVFVEFVFSGVRFITKGAIVFFLRVVGAISMAPHVAPPVRFVGAVPTKIPRGGVVQSKCFERKPAGKSRRAPGWKGRGRRSTLSGSTLHRIRRAHLHGRRRWKGRITNACVG